MITLNRIQTSTFRVLLHVACYLACMTAPFSSAAPHSMKGVQGSEAGATGRTVIEMGEEELRQAYSAELADLVTSSSQDGLDLLLAKIGERVEVFLRSFSNTAAKERVRLQRMAPDGRVEDSARREFNYMILSDFEGSRIRFREDRADSRGRPLDLKNVSGFVMTSGYAGLSLLLHSSHQAGSRYRYLGQQRTQPYAHVLAFAQKPEAKDYLSGYIPTNFSTPIPMLLQGIAWIDPQTYQILRIRTDLLDPILLIGLTRQSSDVTFGEVSFDGARHTLWLPIEVVVSWKVEGRSYRTTHSYSDYKLFTIESYDKVEQPQPKP